MFIRKKLDEMVAKGFITKEAADDIDRKRIDLWKDYLGKKADKLEKIAISPKEIETIVTAMKSAIKNTPKQVTPFMDKAKQVAGLAGITALFGAGTALAEKGIEALNQMHLEGQMENTYSQMLEEFPQLKKSPDSARRMFNVLKTFSPKMATNPVVAGSFVSQQVLRSVVEPEIVSRISSIQNMSRQMTPSITSETLKTFPTTIVRAGMKDAIQ